MAGSSANWVNTAKTDRLREFHTSNTLQRPSFKFRSLPPLVIQEDAPPTPPGKQWTDQSLYSSRSVDNYLAESDAFQRASFANIIRKWKQYDMNRTSRLITSFDTHYNMKKRFQQDNDLNRPSEVKYGHVATYYRFLGSENNPKNLKPCLRHKRRTQDYAQRHVQELLQMPTSRTKTRRPSYFLPKITTLPSSHTADESSSTAKLSEVEHSHQTFS